MRLNTSPYDTQRQRWPQTGRHILAQFDEQTLVVYQAYRPSIGEAAVRDGALGGGGFSFDRMSWIKPNFLWMMYRSGWGTKPGQEVTLAIGLDRAGFDQILGQAVHSSHVEAVYGERDQWKQALAQSPVRLQWDPDHTPSGGKVQRRAVQLGLRGEALRRFAGEWTQWIEDVSPFVAEQRQHVGTPELMTPSEAVYPVTDARTARVLGVARPGEAP